MAGRVNRTTTNKKATKRKVIRKRTPQLSGAKQTGTTRSRKAAAAAAAADPQAEMMATWKKAMTPGPAHARLEPTVGAFDAKIKFWMTPDAPPSEGTGTSRNRWVLGGRYVEQKYRGKSMGMPMQGLGYTGYDNAAKRYVGTWKDSFGTGIMTSSGTGKPTARKMEFESTMFDPFAGRETKQRSVLRIKDEDRHTFEMFAKGPDGKEFRSMLIEYTRK